MIAHAGAAQLLRIQAMELRSSSRDKGPILAAVVALLVLGLGSIFLTWQNIRRQRDLVDQHLELAGGAVVHGVEANLMRVMHSLRRSPDAAQRFFPSIRELFQEMTASGEVVFIGIFDEDGRLVASSAKDEVARDMILPEPIIATLEVEGRWSGALEFEGKTAVFSAIRTRPSLSLLCEGARLGFPIPPEVALRGLGPERLTRRGGGRGRGGAGLGGLPDIGRDHAGQRAGRNHPREHDGRMGMDRMDRMGGMDPGPLVDEPGPARSPDVPSMFLVTGLNPKKHLDQFQAYRRAAVLQTGYVFGAATLLWSLAFAYLRRRNQAMRADQLERFHSKLLDSMPDGLVTLGPDGTILSANGSAARLLLPEAQPDAQGEATPTSISVQTARLIGRNWSEYPFAGQIKPGVALRACPWMQFEHAGRVLEILCLPLSPGDAESGGEELLVLLRDRTRLKTLEDDLAEAKRLAAIGSLAAGVAHEIRNPLSSLRGFAQLFATKLKGQEPLASYASTMVQEADRLNRVVTDLLYLARPRDIAPGEVDLPRLLESLRGLLRFDLEHKHAEPGLDLQETTIYADEDAIKQALLNLIVNALDALPETGGAVTVSTRRSQDEAPGVWLAVTDNGQGMDEATRDKAFEPFFTAKRKGTGLGLAIVQGIMRAHHGRALIESTPGQGTSVRLFFPDAPASDSDSESDAESEPEAGGAAQDASDGDSHDQPAE
jgi:two-component system sensor histidine kinase HydH